MVKYKTEPLRTRDFDSTFSCRQMAKDLDLILGAGHAVGVPLQLAAQVRETYGALIAQATATPTSSRPSSTWNGCPGLANPNSTQRGTPMRNFNQNTITHAVLERIAGATDPRTKQISEALVRHLHDFIREVRPTQKEWANGIDFLTHTGQMCDDTRQEFILLSDTLGVSMLVDAINHRP